MFFIRNKSLIFFFMLLIVQFSRDLSEKCEEYAIKSLCFASLPLCAEGEKEPTSRQLCREECEMLVCMGLLITEILYYNFICYSQ